MELELDDYIKGDKLKYKTMLKARVEEFYNECHVEKGQFGEKNDPSCGQRLATAKPQGVAGRAYHAGLGPKMDVGLITDPISVVRRQAQVPGFEDLKGIRSLVKAKAALETIIQRQTDNIVEYADIVVGSNRKVADAYADWYPFSHNYITSLAHQNGVSEEGAIAATAVLSASAAWESNVPWAKYLVENLGEGKGPGSNTGKYQTVDKSWVAGQATAALASWKANKLKTEKAGREYKTPIPEVDKYSHLIGKQLNSLTDTEVAVALRGKHESGATGKGAEGKLVTQLGSEIHAGFGTKGKGTIPQSLPNMVKAVSVLRDPSAENIDKRIGDQNKVRSFYQNLRAPKDTEFSDVTADTHHFGVANHAPWTMSSGFVGGGTGASKDVVSTPGNAKTGALGTYPLVVEATRRATTQINKKYRTNYTPNQIQSIVWEHHKNYYPPRLRTNKEMQQSIALANTAFAKGEISKTEREARINAARARASTGETKAPTVEELRARYVRGEL